MRKIPLGVALCAVVLVTGAGIAGNKKPQDPNKILCRVESATTSRIAVNRVCHTRAEWKEIDERRSKDAAHLVNGTNDRRLQNGN